MCSTLCGWPRLPPIRGKSNRAIAAEIGVGFKTVERARSVVSDATTEKIIGLDGKSYPAAGEMGLSGRTAICIGGGAAG